MRQPAGDIVSRPDSGPMTEETVQTAPLHCRSVLDVEARPGRSIRYGPVRSRGMMGKWMVDGWKK